MFGMAINMFSNNEREKVMTGATTLVSLVGLAYSLAMVIG